MVNHIVTKYFGSSCTLELTIGQVRESFVSSRVSVSRKEMNLSWDYSSSPSNEKVLTYRGH